MTPITLNIKAHPPLSIVMAINELIIKSVAHTALPSPNDAILTALQFVNEDILAPMQRQSELEDDKKCLEDE